MGARTAAGTATSEGAPPGALMVLTCHTARAQEERGPACPQDKGAKFRLIPQAELDRPARLPWPSPHGQGHAQQDPLPGSVSARVGATRTQFPREDALLRAGHHSDLCPEAPWKCDCPPHGQRPCPSAPRGSERWHCPLGPGRTDPGRVCPPKPQDPTLHKPKGRGGSRCTIGQITRDSNGSDTHGPVRRRHGRCEK